MRIAIEEGKKFGIGDRFVAVVGVEYAEPLAEIAIQNGVNRHSRILEDVVVDNDEAQRVFGAGLKAAQIDSPLSPRSHPSQRAHDAPGGSCLGGRRGVHLDMHRNRTADADLASSRSSAENG